MVASLTGELALAREAVAGRLRGVDPTDFPALRRAYDAFYENDPMPEGAGQSEVDLGGVACLGVVPKGANSDQVMIWLHGGGYRLGSPQSHKGLASKIASLAKCATVIPAYRLAPEAAYPAALEDAVNVYKAVLGEGIPASRIILAGDSAGGGLAVSTLLRARADGVELPAGVLLLAPWVNLACDGWSMQAKAERDALLTKGGLQACAASYLGQASAKDPYLDVLNADLSGLPPTFIQTGEADILLSDSTALAERLGAAGAPLTLEIWPDMFHVFQARYPVLSPARLAAERLGAWAAAHASA